MIIAIMRVVGNLIGIGIVLLAVVLTGALAVGLVRLAIHWAFGS